jgi:hypothetical protein
MGVNHHLGTHTETRTTGMARRSVWQLSSAEEGLRPRCSDNSGLLSQTQSCHDTGCIMSDSQAPQWRCSAGCYGYVTQA